MNVAATVVGAGVVAPGGATLDDLWMTIRNADGTRAEVVGYEELPDIAVLGCRASGFDPAERLERHELRRLDRSHQMAFWAADDAMAAAGESPPPDRCAVVVGTGFGAAEFQAQQQRAFMTRGFRALSPLTIPVVMQNSIAAHLSMRFGFRGPSLTVASACASGADAIGEALWMLRSGRADRVLAGGVDALHTVGVSGAFARMEAMSMHVDDPTTSSRPFDAARDGFVLGEGAGFMVLERADDPKEGDEAGFGVILGYASTSDANHVVAPLEDGGGAAECMRLALADAGVDASMVGNVNAHGTSTPKNDLAEAHAIASIFGPRSVPVTANKGVIGHLIGAAGAVEAIVALRANREMIVPRIANLANPDPRIADLIDLAIAESSNRSPITASNSFGFGGHNATLILA